MEKVEIPVGESNLWISCGRDGTWLHFEASNGKSAAINVDLIGAKGGIIGEAIAGWCEDCQGIARQIRADNGQFGVGA